MARRLTRALVFCTLLLMACGDDGGGGVDGGGGDGIDSDLLGFYTITEWTENDGACSTPGPSILASHTDNLLVVYPLKLGDWLLDATTCVSPAECADVVNRDSYGYVTFTFIDGNDADGWSFALYSGSSSGANCDAQAVVQTLTSPTTGSIRIERRETVWTYAITGDNCTASEVQARAAAESCDELTILDADFDGPLP